MIFSDPTQNSTSYTEMAKSLVVEISEPVESNIVRFDRDVSFFPVGEWLKHHNLESPYNLEYWEKYLSYRDSEINANLTGFRVSIVRDRLPDLNGRYLIMDFGIGNGSFVQKMTELYPNSTVYGVDINPFALEWMAQNGIHHSKTIRRELEHQVNEPWDRIVYCYWDSLEHVADVGSYLPEKPGSIAIVSAPIRTTNSDLASWKHFREDEHYWYWSSYGFARHMAQHGMTLIGYSREETRLGREDITTYTLVKKS